MYNTRSPWPNEGKLSALHIRQACDDSLRRLQTDHIDLYQMHHVDRDTPWDEIWQAMDLLVAQGKVLYVGSSNFAGWHIVEGERGGAPPALARPRVGAEPLQPERRGRWSSRCSPRARTTARRDPVEPARRRPARRRARRPRSGGRRGGEHIQAQIESQRTKLEAWEKLCAEIGAAPADVALAWLLHNPVVTAPIIGPRTVAQVDDALGALDVRLADDVLAELDHIFPGPGGPAPEAYAW